jgi:hypothetical protein
MDAAGSGKRYGQDSIFSLSGNQKGFRLRTFKFVQNVADATVHKEFQFKNILFHAARNFCETETQRKKWRLCQKQ